MQETHSEAINGEIIKLVGVNGLAEHKAIKADSLARGLALAKVDKSPFSASERLDRFERVFAMYIMGSSIGRIAKREGIAASYWVPEATRFYSRFEGHCFQPWANWIIENRATSRDLKKYWDGRKEER